MTTHRQRQQLLFLCLKSPELNSEVVAWALYDGTLPENEIQMETGDMDIPPYRSVLSAMRDGWRVIHIPPLPYLYQGQENQLGYLPHEYVLERMVNV